MSTMSLSRRQLMQKFAIGVAAVPLAGCGSILYPERRGQQGGRIDAGVAVLDGVGLLLFLIPGIIAFAVDFHTGAIYVPGTYSDADGEQDLAEIKVDKPLTNAEMDRIWAEQYGEARPFRNEELRSQPLASLDEAYREVRFAMAANAARAS